CATRGEAGDVDRLDPGTDIAVAREAELRAAGEELGVSRFILLGYRDSGMTGEPGPFTLAGAPFADVVSVVLEVIDQIDPDVVVTLDPDHGDGHRDHAVIGRATVEAGRDRPDIRLYAWALTRSLLTRWLGELQDVRPGSENLD